MRYSHSFQNKPEQTLNQHTRRPARQTGANLGFEDKLWMAADKLRGTMDAAEYKHVVLGLIFLKYISDAFADQYAALEREPYADPEDRLARFMRLERANNLFFGKSLLLHLEISSLVR